MNEDPLPPSDPPVTRTLLPANPGFFIVSVRCKLKADSKPEVKDNHKIPVVAWLLQSGAGNMTNPVPLWPAHIAPPDPDGWMEYVGVLMPDTRVLNDQGMVFKSMATFRTACAGARQTAYLIKADVEGEA